MEDVLNHLTTDVAAPENGHPGSEAPINKKGDLFIVAQLQRVRFRNRSGDNPNLGRSRMFFDFDAGRVVWGNE
jgi:hypothetical protein